MIEFIYHDGLNNTIAALEKRRFRNLRDAFHSLEKLCQLQFNPESPKQVIAPGKLHRRTQNDIWVIWKVELMVPKSGLRPNQSPRLWFVVSGSVIAFLCLATHIDNYDDNTMDRLAEERVTDIF